MLINIQFLRFAAAMMVVIYHVAMQWNPETLENHGFLALGAATGFAGVDVFFVISGFIMAYTTGETAGYQPGSVFTRKRFARIYSGHWPFFVLSLLVFAWTRGEHVSNSDLLASFFLWPQPLNQILLQVTWTLSFELYFYLLFALMIWLVPAHRRMALCALLTGALLLAALVRHFSFGSFDPERLFLMPFWEHFLVSPFVSEFFAGAVTAYWLQRRRSGWSTAWLAAGLTLFLISGLINEALFDGNIEQGFFVVPRVLLFGTASVMIITGLVRLEFMGRLAPRKFSILCGGASYAIYLCHILIISIAARLGLFSSISGWSFGVATLAYLSLMALILAYAVGHYKILEQPLHRAFRNWTGVGPREKD
ncbi:MAG: acyltransferase [Xanthomonadales bacterium]|nr:acyltransferase [Xanthomonadales bacterium]